jgi:uncharacterized protein (TIGR00730 family)
MLGAMGLGSVAVYCASSPGADPVHSANAALLGRTLAARSIRLVYGGGHVGLMGVIADAVITAGGDVLGVITDGLMAKEVGHPSLPELRVASTMHERKAAMADAADGFVMLPGGFGTFDEFFEMLTWTQLGIHDKPCGILDPTGFYQPLLAQLDAAVDAGFLRLEHRVVLLDDTDADRLLDRFVDWRPPMIDKWLGRTDR